MAKFNGDLTPIVDFVGVALDEAKDQTCLELWREAEFGFSTTPDRAGYDEFYIQIGLRPKAYRSIGGEKKREELQQKIKSIAEPVVNGYDDLYLERVYIYPIAEPDDSWRGGVARPVQASTDEAARLWKEGHFRLFLSHSSANKEFGAELKESLGKVKVDVFVAHEDIEPNLTWQQEIKLALASCHSLLFLATETSNQSWWCQQEVGWGLGRGVLVTSYMLEKEPVGFANGLQGWKVRKHDLLEIRKKLLTMFAKDDRTEPSMHEPLVQLVQSSKTAEQIDYALDYLELLKSLNQSDLERISTVTSQPFVAKSRELKARMQAALVNFGYSPAVAATPAVDEYDPFADD